MPKFDPFCRDAVVSVGEGKVQSALWKYDIDHNHILDSYDVMGEPTTYFPGGAGLRLAQLLVNAQHSDGGKLKFISLEAVVSYARACLAIDRAYDTVQFLQDLPSHHVNKGILFTEHEYDAAGWQKIVNRLGVGGDGYAIQVRAAYVAIEAFMKSAKMVTHTLESTHGEVISRDAWILDPTSLPLGIRTDFTTVIQKLAVVHAFASCGEIECEGWSCPSGSESLSPFDSVYHGPRIAMRMDDTPKGERVFLQFTTPWGWSNTPNNIDYLQERLAGVTFTPTSASK